MPRKNISSGSPLETPIGFSRAVRIKNIIAVSGTAPIAPDGSVSCPGDLYGQTKRCLEIIIEAVNQAGGALPDIIRTRIMLTDMGRWREAARAHGEFFSGTGPACTFVEVKGFINREWLFEVEADAVLDQ